MTKRINVFLDDQEELILNALINKYGGRPPQILRDALKYRFDKAFPAHTIKSDKVQKVDIIPEEKLTPEQICEKHGGVVVTKNGMKYCQRQINPGSTESLLLGHDEIEDW